MNSDARTAHITATPAQQKAPHPIIKRPNALAAQICP
jgi:hypothetical protein